MALGESCALYNRINLKLASVFYPRSNDFQVEKDFDEFLWNHTIM